MHPVRIIGIFCLIVALGLALTAVIWPIKFSKREKVLGPQWSDKGKKMDLPAYAPSPYSNGYTLASLPLNLNQGQWNTFRLDVPKGSNGTVINFEVYASEIRLNRELYFTPSYAEPKEEFTSNTVKFYHPKQAIQIGPTPVVVRNWTVCEGSNYVSFYYTSTNTSDTNWNVSGDCSRVDWLYNSIVCLNYFVPAELEGLIYKIGAIGLGLVFGIPALCCLVGGLICFACGKSKQHHYQRF